MGPGRGWFARLSSPVVDRVADRGDFDSDELRQLSRVESVTWPERAAVDHWRQQTLPAAGMSAGSGLRTATHSAGKSAETNSWNSVWEEITGTRGVDGRSDPKQLAVVHEARQVDPA